MQQTIFHYFKEHERVSYRLVAESYGLHISAFRRAYEKWSATITAPPSDWDEVVVQCMTVGPPDRLQRAEGGVAA